MSDSKVMAPLAFLETFLTKPGEPANKPSESEGWRAAIFMIKLALRAFRCATLFNAHYNDH